MEKKSRNRAHVLLCAADAFFGVQRMHCLTSSLRLFPSWRSLFFVRSVPPLFVIT